MILKNNSKINEIKNYLKKSNDYEDKDAMIKFLKGNNNLPFNEDVLYDILKIIIDNNLEFRDAIYASQQLYSIIVSDEKNLEQYKLFLSIFPMFIKNSSLSFKNIINFQTLYYMFENKQLLINLYNRIQNVKKEDLLFKYIIEIREYFVDEIAFYSSIMKFIDILENTWQHCIIEELMEEQIENAKKMAGLYEIDEDELKYLPMKIEKLNKRQDELEEKLNKANRLVDEFLLIIDENIEKDNRQRKESLEEIKQYISEFKKNNVISKEDTKESKIDKLIEQLILFNNKSYEEKNLEIKSNIDTKDKNQLLNLNRNVNLNSDIIIDNILLRLKGYIYINTNNEIGNGSKEIDEKMKKIIRRLVYIDKNNIVNLPDELYYTLYYYALYNNTLDILNEIACRLKLETISFLYLKYDIVSKFNKDVYLKLVLERGYLITNTFSKNIDLLAKLIAINPDFDTEHSTEFIMEAINLFGIDTVAQPDPIFEENLDALETRDLSTYKSIYDINKDFKVFDGFVLLNDNNIFTLEEFANFNQEMTEKVEKNLNIIRNVIYRYGIKYKDFLRKFILLNDLECEFHIRVFDLFDLGYITPEEYLLLDNKISNELLWSYINLKNNYEGIKKIDNKIKLKKQLRKANKYLKNKECK